MAITEANLDNYPAFYLGRSKEAKEGYQMLDTKLRKFSIELQFLVDENK